MTTTPDDRMTQGEARIWARRFRKVGFGPVTVHHDPDGAATGELLGGGYYLDCNWPCEFGDLPPDLYHAFAFQDYGSVEGTYEDWTLLQRVVNRQDARRMLARFRAVRLGMGSRPLPTVGHDPWEPQFISIAWLRADYDDWPRETWRHPDYTPDPVVAIREPRVDPADRRGDVVTARRQHYQCPCCGYFTLDRRGGFQRHCQVKADHVVRWCAEAC